MRRFICILAVAGLGSGPLPSQAQQAGVALEPADRVTLDEALERFVEHGLAIRIARADALESTKRAQQGAAWPNPVGSTYHESLDADSDFSGGEDHSETTSELTQPIVWPWRWTALGEVADAQAQEAQANFRADSAAAALHVVRSWLDAWRSERSVAAVAEAADVFRDGDRAASERYEEGDLSGFDLRRLRIERTRYEADLDAGRLALQSAQRQLATLIAPDVAAQPIGAAIGELGLPPPVKADVVIAMARSQRPEIAAAEARVAASEAVLRATRWERLPDPTLRAGWKNQSDELEGPVVGLSLSLPLFDRGSAAVEAARSDLASAQSHRALIARRVEDEIRFALERHESLLARSALFEERLLADADDLLEIARVSYDAGEISLLELLDGARAWRDALVTRIELQADLWESWYELQRAVGGSSADVTPMESATGEEP